MMFIGKLLGFFFRVKKEKDSIENQLSHTSKELEIAKKESHIPRSPTRYRCTDIICLLIFNNISKTNVI